MLKRFTIVLFLLIGTGFLFAQQRDYTKIRFKSKLRNYTNKLPNPKRYKINKDDIVELVGLLTIDLYTDKDRRELTIKLWLALSNPKMFDFVYKDYSINTIKNWGKKIKFEDPNFEPNPYLAEWTKKEDDILYFQWAMTNILTYEGLMEYGDEAKKVYLGIRNLKYLKNYKFPRPKSDDFSESYLQKINKAIAKDGLVILKFKHNFDYIACKTSVKDAIIEKFEKFYWAFGLP